MMSDTSVIKCIVWKWWAICIIITFVDFSFAYRSPKFKRQEEYCVKDHTLQSWSWLYFYFSVHIVHRAQRTLLLCPPSLPPPASSSLVSGVNSLCKSGLGPFDSALSHPSILNQNLHDSTVTLPPPLHSSLLNHFPFSFSLKASLSFSWLLTKPSWAIWVPLIFMHHRCSISY